MKGLGSARVGDCAGGDLSLAVKNDNGFAP